MSRNGTRALATPTTPIEVHIAAESRRSATLAKWIVRSFLGIGSVGNLIGAAASGSVWLGIVLAVLAGGQATAAVLLSRE